MKEGKETFDNMLALARYVLFANNKALTVHLLELIDGAEVMENLSENLKQKVGEDKWKEVFGHIKLPALVTQPRDKPKITKKVMERLEANLDKEKCREVLASNLHFVPDEAVTSSKKAFQESANIDDFLRNRHEEYVEELAEHAKEKTLYYTQEIDDEVVEYVRRTPTCQVEVREGDVIYVTKIPYMAKKYLHEKDEKMKRYYARALTINARITGRKLKKVRCPTKRIELHPEPNESGCFISAVLLLLGDVESQCGKLNLQVGRVFRNELMA